MRSSIIKKSVSLCLLLAMCCIFAVSCMYKGYPGEYTDLYSEAQAELVFAEGYTIYGEIFVDAELDVIETDNYGRRLFAYYEHFNNSISIMISQMTKDGYVYYHNEFCFVNLKFDNLNEIENSEKSFKECAEDIIKKYDIQGTVDLLKHDNDWNKPFDESKMTRTKVSTNFDNEGKHKISDAEYIALFKKHSESYGLSPEDDDLYVRNEGYAYSDAEGRELRYALVEYETVEGKVARTDYYYLIVITEPDGTLNMDKCAALLDNNIFYRGYVLMLKYNNNWSASN